MLRFSASSPPLKAVEEAVPFAIIIAMPSYHMPWSVNPAPEHIAAIIAAVIMPAS